MARSSLAVRLHSAGAIVAGAATVAVALLWPSALFGQTWQVVEYYDTDALGSIRIVTDAQGQIVARHEFLPFGEELSPQTPPRDKKLFTSQERDVETGQDYFGARYYRAGLGRFTTVDPGHVNGAVEDPQSWNAYAYARNNPLRFIDAEGLAYRVVVDGGASPVWYLDDRQFEWMIAHPELNPGISFNNGVITAGGKTVGSYQHFGDSDAMIGLAGDLAAYGLRREGREMAIDTAIAASGGLASGVLGGVAATSTLGLEAPSMTELPNVTARGARMANFAVKLSAREFQSNLVRSGYRVIRQGVDPNGPWTMLGSGEKTYTIYTATSTGWPAAEVRVAGQLISKIRLGGF